MRLVIAIDLNGWKEGIFSTYYIDRKKILLGTAKYPTNTWYYLEHDLEEEEHTPIVASIIMRITGNDLLNKAHTDWHTFMFYTQLPQIKRQNPKIQR